MFHKQIYCFEILFYSEVYGLEKKKKDLLRVAIGAGLGYVLCTATCVLQ